MHSEPPSQSDTRTGPEVNGPPASPSKGEGEAVLAVSSPSLEASDEGPAVGPGGTLRSGSASSGEGAGEGPSDAAVGAASTVRFGASGGEPQAAPDAPDSGAADELLGQVISGRWKVTRLLGQGGMGAVYEAQNVAIGKRVALKFIVAEAATDPEVISRFQREAQAASSVESAHIVEVFDTGTSERGLPYLVMELLRGESLGARLRRAGKLPPGEAVHIVAQALRGLARAHAAGVIHRDLKPDNVFLVDRDDDPLFVKILDFGISKIARRPGEVGVGTLTRKGTVLGTPYYMSPEQAQAHGDLDERTDIFSMGAILFECLTGRAPCAGLGTYEAVIVAICSRDAPDVRTLEPGVPAPLAAVVSRALARERGARFPSAAAFFEALRDAMPGVISSRGPSPGGPATPSPREAEQAAPGGQAGPGEAPQTRTSWTSRDGAPIAPTLRAPDGRPAGLRRLLLLGGGTAALAFVATLVVMRLGSPPPSPPLAVASAGRPSPPEVSLRIEAPQGARVLIDGKVVPDGIIRGPALSSHQVRVEAEGHAPAEREVLLDGRPSLKLEPWPEVAPAAPPSSASSPPASSSSPPAATSPPVKPAGSAKGTSKKPPASDEGGGLKLKVNP